MVKTYGQTVTVLHTETVLYDKRLNSVFFLSV